MEVSKINGYELKDSEARRSINENETLFNQKMGTKKNYFKQRWLKNDFILIVSYYNDERKLYVSNDGVNLYKLGNIDLEELWDISCIFHNNYFYIIGDIFEKDYEDYSNYPYRSGGNRVPIYKTKNFLSFEKSYVEIPSIYKQTWAPDFVIDSNNQLHIVVTLSECKETYEFQGNISSQTRYKNKTYLISLTDNEETGFFNYSDPIQISLDNDETDKIDSHIFYDDISEKYYLTIKNRSANPSTILMYSSSNLTNGYTLINTFTKNVSYDTEGFEGSSIVKFKENYILTAQSTTTNRYNFAYISDSLPNFNVPPKTVSSNDDTVVMHYTPLVINNYEAKLGIEEFIYEKGVNVFTDENNKLIHREKIIINNENGYAIFTETGNFIALDFYLMNEEGIASGSELFTIPYKPNTVQSFNILGGKSAYLESSNVLPAGLTINKYGVCKIGYESTDIYKRVEGHIVINKHGKTIY